MRLHQTVKQQDKIIEVQSNGLTDIINYLCCPKFQGADNNYVNPADIILRIREIQEDVRFYEDGNNILV